MKYARVKQLGTDTRITATAQQTYAWAHRPNCAWPCSDLSGHRIGATINKRGDLVDFNGPTNVSSNELNAFIQDALFPDKYETDRKGN